MSVQLTTNKKLNKKHLPRYYGGKYKRRAALVGLGWLGLCGLVAVPLGFVTPFVLLGLGLLILVALVIYRPIVGYFLALLVAASLEAFNTLDPISPATSKLYKSLSTFAGIPLPLSGFEILVLLTTGLSWFYCYQRNEPFWQRGYLSRAWAIFGACCLIGFVNGVGRGGTLNIAIFEMRAIIGAFLLFHLTCHYLKDFQHWKIFAWCLPIGITILSFFTFYRYILIGGDMNKAEVTDSLNAANHSTAIFFLLMIFWMLCTNTYGTWPGHRFVSWLLVAPMFYAMLISGRRVAFACMIFCLGAFGIMLIVRNRRTGYIASVIAIIVLVPYMAAFWNSDNIVGLPAKSVRSQISPDERDASSDLYRLLEKTNVYMTIKAEPIGVGFGRPFTPYLGLISLGDFAELQLYTPHVQFLWVWLKTGFLGFGAFCFLIALSLFEFAQVVRRGKSGPEFTLVVLSGLMLVAWVVYVYVDTGLIDARLMAYVGVFMGLIDIFYRQLSPVKKVSKNQTSHRLSVPVKSA